MITERKDKIWWKILKGGVKNVLRTEWGEEENWGDNEERNRMIGRKKRLENIEKVDNSTYTVPTIKKLKNVINLED